MPKDDDYLEELEKLKHYAAVKTHRRRNKEGRSDRNDYRKAISTGNMKDFGHPRNVLKEQGDYLRPDSNYPVSQRLGYARSYLNESAGQGNIQGALEAAEVYAQLDRGDRPIIKRKLLDAVKNSAKNPRYRTSNTMYEIEQVEKFIKQHSSKARKLEQTVATVAIVGLLSGLVLLFPVFTGNSINSTSSGILSSTTPYIGGSILLLAGIIAAFLSLRK